MVRLLLKRREGFAQDTVLGFKPIFFEKCFHADVKVWGKLVRHDWYSLTRMVSQLLPQSKKAKSGSAIEPLRFLSSRRSGQGGVSAVEWMPFFRAVASAAAVLVAASFQLIEAAFQH